MSTPCSLCPRSCKIDRSERRGYCGAGDLPYIARYMLHQWEEPFISGKSGAGAIFFCGCNLDCVFCQNHDINHSSQGFKADASALAEIMLKLQEEGASTIDLVTPTPHIDTIIPAIEAAKLQGLSIPIVYNTNAYECTGSLRRLDGLIDIYLPDLKYITPATAKKYSCCEDYFEYAAPAIELMYNQVGDLFIGDDGIAKRGLLIRHLVLPGAIGETRRILDYLAEHYSPRIYLALMGQYIPSHKASIYPPLDRKLMKKEYERAIDYCISLGFQNVLIQSLASADSSYTPIFVHQVDNL